MRYLADVRFPTSFGQFIKQELTPEQVVAWLNWGPVETRIRRPSIARQLHQRTGYPLVPTGEHLWLWQDMDLYAADQALLCCSESDEKSQELHQAPCEERDPCCLRFTLYTCLERYGYQLSPPLPENLDARTEAGKAARRFVTSSLRFDGEGLFDFRLLSRGQAIRWLARGPVVSRFRLAQFTTALGYLTGTSFRRSGEKLPALQQGDQVLVFFVGPRSPGIRWSSLGVHDVLLHYDFALVSCQTTEIAHTYTLPALGRMEASRLPVSLS